MSGPAELAIAAGVLVDAGLKATVVLGLGAVLTRIPGTSAAHRHALWSATFATLPLLPWFAAQRGAEIALDLPWLVGVWMLGVVVASMPLLRGLLELRRLRAEAVEDPEVRGLIHSERVRGPLTWGLFRPVVLLPTSAARWSETHRAAALAHERAHIIRRDWAVHVAVWTVSALFWFHPLVWWARRALSREAEHAADDIVLSHGVQPSDYATLLVDLASAAPQRAALGVASSMVGTRVRALLAPRSRGTRRWPTWMLALLLATFSLPALGAWPTWTAPEETLTCSPAPTP